MRRDWIKVRSAWWTDPDHVNLTGHALRFGVYLLYLADSDPDWQESGNARLVDGRGVALGLSDVCARAGVRLREGRRWVNALLVAGTLDVDSEGAYFFPNYRKHQENPSAKRKRKQRDSHAKASVTVTVEEEEEEEAEDTKQRLSEPVSKQDAFKAAHGLTRSELAGQVVAHLRLRKREAGGKVRVSKLSKSQVDRVCKPLNKGHSLADWLYVIDRQSELCMLKPDELEWFTLSTLSGPNFLRRLDAEPVSVQDTGDGENFRFHHDRWQLRIGETTWETCSEVEAREWDWKTQSKRG